jgi:hypothetical protein
VDEKNCVELAVICERVTRALDDYQELRKIVTEQTSTLNNILVIQNDIVNLSSKNDQLFKIVQDQIAITCKQESRLLVHSTVWKICAATLLASIGLIGWGYQTLTELNKADKSNEVRIVKLETRLFQPFNKSGDKND